MVVPGVHEIEPALLYPTAEIGLRNLVRKAEDTIVGSKDLDRSLLDRNTSPAELRRERCKVSAVEVADARVVLRHQRASTRNEIEQPLIVDSNFLLRVIGANSQDYGSVAAQILAGP